MGINTHTNKRKLPNRETLKRRRQIAKNAAARTLNGNGSSPDLPPLPQVHDKKENALGTLFSHRYGALPYGNIFMSSTRTKTQHKDAVRHNGLGPNLKLLNDEQILVLLQFLDGDSLSQIVQCSRYLYVAGHHDDLWRDLTLRKYGKDGFLFCKSWKDTFVSSERKTMKNEQTKVFQPHQPIQMKNIFSDTFFRSWLCRNFTIQDSWLSVNNICTEEATSLTVEKFLDYEEKNIPLLIKGATKNWPALQKWNQEYLSKQSEGVKFRATSGTAPFPANFTIEEYAKYCEDVSEEAPLYLFDRTFAKKCPQLLHDYYDGLKESCPYFDDEATHGHDLFSVLGKEKRPDHRWIIIGPKRSFSNFHIDPNATHAWNAPIIGRKRWIFYPPGVNPPGVFPSPNGDDVVMPISLGEWFLTHYNDHVRQRSNPDVTKRPLECTAYPGDILFVPHGYWHSVLNLDDGMSVALTQNYVSASNLPDVLRFLKTKQQQISGCRDRAEAIQPELLLETFTSRLNEARPALLEKAKDLANECWHCAAWDDYKGDDEKTSHKAKKAKKVQNSIVQRAKINSTDEQQGQSSNMFTFSFLQ